MARVVPPTASSPPMVGRKSELAALVEAGRASTSGVPAVALVGGRAGMGKTRLVSEAARQWKDEGFRVLVGGCAPLEGTPYTALVSALRGALPATAPLFRMLTMEQATSRRELFESLGTALDELSALDPLILVAEDLHWSDRATRDALIYVVTPGRGGPRRAGQA